MDHLSAVFPSYYQPAQWLSVDEMTIGTRCRNSFLQYLPQKPTEFGIKVFEGKSGYAKAGVEKGKGVGHRVVMDILQPFWERNIGYLLTISLQVPHSTWIFWSVIPVPQAL